MRAEKAATELGCKEMAKSAGRREDLMVVFKRDVFLCQSVYRSRYGTVVGSVE